MTARFPRRISIHRPSTLTTSSKAKRANGRGNGPWFTYIVECADGTFYTGITNHLARRLAMHNDGAASRYTRTRRPVRYRYTEQQSSRSAALVREIEIKRWTRAKKTSLFRSAGNLLRG